MLYIITILAFVSAIFLVAATMSALIAEQAREIAVLKVLGGRRRQIGGITARTAGLLGLAAAVAGTILGVAVAYLLARYFAERIVDVSLGFGISAPVVVASLVAGPMLAVAASLPALRRTLRKPAAEALTGVGTDGGYGSGRLDRAAARSGLLRGSLIPDTMRMGLRDVLRQKRRSIAVIAQVAVAAGLAISFLALGQSITAVIGQTIRKLHVSIDVGQAGGSGQRAAAHGRSAARHSPLPPPRRASPAPSQWRQAPCSTTARPTPCGASAPVRSMPPARTTAAASSVAACPLLALLLSVELLNRALKRHRFQAATFHSSHILP